MALSDAALTTAAGSLAAVIDLIKLHSGAPGAAGTANVIASAESACTYAAGAAGVIDLASTVEVDVGGGATVSHFSLWDGTSFQAGEVFTSNAETYSNAGKANVTSASITVS